MFSNSSSALNTAAIFLNRVKGYWFLVPLFAPFLGAVVGVVIYQLMVGYNVEGEARIQGRREEEGSLLSTTTINEEA